MSPLSVSLSLVCVQHISLGDANLAQSRSFLDLALPARSNPLPRVALGHFESVVKIIASVSRHAWVAPQAAAALFHRPISIHAEGAAPFVRFAWHGGKRLILLDQK